MRELIMSLPGWVLVLVVCINLAGFLWSVCGIFNCIDRFNIIRGEIEGFNNENKKA